MVLRFGGLYGLDPSQRSPAQASVSQRQSCGHSPVQASASSNIASVGMEEVGVFWRHEAHGMPFYIVDIVGHLPFGRG